MNGFHHAMEQHDAILVPPEGFVLERPAAPLRSLPRAELEHLVNEAVDSCFRNMRREKKAAAAAAKQEQRAPNLNDERTGTDLSPIGEKSQADAARLAKQEQSQASEKPSPDDNVTEKRHALSAVFARRAAAGAKPVRQRRRPA